MSFTRLAMSPGYAELFCKEIVDPAAWSEGQRMKYASQFTLSDEKRQALLDSSEHTVWTPADHTQVELDLHRTHWQLGSEAATKNSVTGLQEYASDEARLAPFQALACFALLNNEKTVVQGGVFQMGSTMSMHLMSLFGLMPFFTQGEKRIDQLGDVMQVQVDEVIPKESWIKMYDAATMEGVQETLAKTHYVFQVTRTDQGYHIAASPEYLVEMDSVFWGKVIRSQVLETLSEASFDEPRAVLPYLPFLTDAVIMRAFSDKLMHASDAVFTQTLLWVEMCYPEQGDLKLRLAHMKLFVMEAQVFERAIQEKNVGKLMEIAKPFLETRDQLFCEYIGAQLAHDPALNTAFSERVKANYTGDTLKEIQLHLLTGSMQAHQKEQESVLAEKQLEATQSTSSIRKNRLSLLTSVSGFFSPSRKPNQPQTKQARHASTSSESSKESDDSGLSMRDKKSLR